jgi:segregation and condensation protein A
MDYQVDLDTFRGPLDLLLYLVKRQEVDVCDIPIAQVADQFLSYLEMMQVVDVERAGDFLVMAATLMEIKSRMLLPRQNSSDDAEPDPRQELVRQLMEYKRFKDAAARLEAFADEHSCRLSRPAFESAAVPAAEQPLRQVELWDLVSAFGRLMRETLALEPQQIIADQTPLHVYMDAILGQVAEAGRLPFTAVFTPPYQRSRLVGLFLAVLELIRDHKIFIDQPEVFGPIELSLAPPIENSERSAG